MGIQGVLNVLRHLKMMPGEPADPPLRLWIERTRWIRSRKGGILDLKVDLGAPLSRGRRSRSNNNPFGRERSLLKAPSAGIVLGLTQLPLVHPGDAICHVALVGRQEMDAWRAYWEETQGTVGFLHEEAALHLFLATGDRDHGDLAGILLGRKGGAAGDGPTVLVWRLAGPVLEQREPRASRSAALREQASIAELYPALRAARQDSGVRGLAVYIQDADLGLAKAQELRRQMMALRRAGKFVECYLETAGEGSNGTLAYYLATACERSTSPRRGPQPDRALRREPVPARRLRQAQDRARLQPRRPLQERRRGPTPRPSTAPRPRRRSPRCSTATTRRSSPPSPRRATRARPRCGR